VQAELNQRTGAVGQTGWTIVYIVLGNGALKMFCEQERTGMLFNFYRVMAACVNCIIYLLSSYVANSLWL